MYTQLFIECLQQIGRLHPGDGHTEEAGWFACYQKIIVFIHNADLTVALAAHGRLSSSAFQVTFGLVVFRTHVLSKFHLVEFPQKSLAFNIVRKFGYTIEKHSFGLGNAVQFNQCGSEVL